MRRRRELRHGPVPPVPRAWPVPAQQDLAARHFELPRPSP